MALAGLALLLAACGGPVAQPRALSGAAIAAGAGPGGALDACFTCHGFAGEGRDDAPRLAGVDVGYLSKQLFDYASGARADETMGPIAQQLTDRDKLEVARHYAAMPGPAPLTAALALYAQGDTVRDVRACARCHGAGGVGRGSANPAIVGQPAAYTAAQLRRWKHGTRRNDAGDVMGAIARRLSDEEIDVLARYLEGAQDD